MPRWQRRYRWGKSEIERLADDLLAVAHAGGPQQIFESLNATGRPLTESEKVKNWLLMGRT